MQYEVMAGIVGSGGLRLTLEPLPDVEDGGLSRKLPKHQWARARQRVLEEHGYRCAACGDEGRKGSPLHCHEVWQYDFGSVREAKPAEVEARRARSEALNAGAEARDEAKARKEREEAASAGAGEAWSVVRAVGGHSHVVKAPQSLPLRPGKVFPLCRPYKPLLRVAPAQPSRPTCSACRDVASDLWEAEDRLRELRVAGRAARAAERERKATMPVGIRRLVGFVALCGTCHSVKHTLHSTCLPHPRWENYWNWEREPDGEWAEFRRSRPLPVAPGEKLKAELERQEQQRKTWGDYREENALRQCFYREEAAKSPSERRPGGDDLTWSLERYRVELEERGEEARRWLENLDRRCRRTPLRHFVEVNRHVSLDVLEAHIFEVKRLWEERARARWRADYNGFDQL